MKAILFCQVIYFAKKEEEEEEKDTSKQGKTDKSCKTVIYAGVSIDFEVRVRG